MVSSGTDKSNEVIMEINQALKQHLRIFQFSENILAVVSSSRGESTSETGRSPGVGLEAPQRTAKQASAATNKRLKVSLRLPFPNLSAAYRVEVERCAPLL